jgi:hypothetical protein
MRKMGECRSRRARRRVKSAAAPNQTQRGKERKGKERKESKGKNSI